MMIGPLGTMRVGLIRCVAAVVVIFDVVKVDRFGDARPLIQFACIGEEVGIVDQPLQIALEMADIDRIETHQRREQPPIGFGNPFADQISLLGQACVQLSKGFEQRPYSIFVSVLAGCEARFVNAVVNAVVDFGIDVIDFGTQYVRVKVFLLCADPIERMVHHADDLGGLVADDRRLFLVPKQRHGDTSGVGRLGAGVDLVQIVGGEEVIAGGAVLGRKTPAVFGH